MKIMSFSAVEILPALLDKSKTQTIRPAWSRFTNTDKQRKPYHKVGDEVRLMWKQRSKYRYFCSKCGIGCDNDTQQVTKNCECITIGVIDKTQRNVIITEVLEIEMFRFEEEQETICVTYSGGEERPTMTDKDMEEIAKRDGFNSSIDMIKYFEKNYISKGDTSTKKFYVYRWRNK